MTLSPDGTPSAGPLLDHEQLSIFLDIGMDEFHEIFRDVVTDVPVAFAAIRDAHAGGRYDVFRSRVHSVRGMLANFGCQSLVAKLHSLEASPTLPGIPAATLHEELLAFWQATRTAIEQWAAENG